MQILRSVILINIGEMFFRAPGLRVGLEMFRSMVTNFSLASIRDGTIGVDKRDCLLLAVSLFIVFIVSLLWEKGVSLRTALAAKPLVFRWAVYYGLFAFVLVFGAYGVGYAPVDPIYAGF